MITLSILALVVFAYYGGASCPKMLKDNRQMLLGVVVGLALVSFMGVGIEGYGEYSLPSGRTVNITEEWCQRCGGTNVADASYCMEPFGGVGNFSDMDPIAEEINKAIAEHCPSTASTDTVEM